MPEVFYTMLTNAGKAKIANATILNTKVNFSKIAVGDSNGSYYNPTEVQTSLVHEVWQGSVGNIKIDEHNSNWIVVESIVPPTVGGFMIREVGLFDENGDLLVIAKYPETYKPTANDGTVKDLVIKLVLEVANTSVVTLKIDPTVIVATKQDIIDMGNKKANLIHNHNDLYHTKTEISTLLDNKINKIDMSIVTQIFNLKENSNLISGTIQIQKNKFFIEYILNFKVKKDYNSNLLMSIPEGFNIYKSIHVPMTVRFVNSKINNETKAESTIGLLLFDHINKQITFWDIGNVTQSDYPPQTSAMIFFAHFFTFVK